MTIFIGIDPGSVSGAVGAILSNGDYLDSFMIEHQDKHILPMVFKNMILRLADPKEGAEICCESVHSMPNQGVASTFQFGRAVGVITAVCTHGKPSEMEETFPHIQRQRRSPRLRSYALA